MRIISYKFTINIWTVNVLRSIHQYNPEQCFPPSLILQQITCTAILKEYTQDRIVVDIVTSRPR